MAAWVDVTDVAYWTNFGADPQWDGTGWVWPNWIARDYLIGDPAFMASTTAIRLTINLSNGNWLFAANFRAVDDALNNLGSATTVTTDGSHVVEINIDPGQVATMIRFDLRYFDMYISKIEVYTDWYAGCSLFWTNHSGQYEVCV